MSRQSEENPLLEPIRHSFEVKRRKKTALVSRNWLLIVLLILDLVRESKSALEEDDVYTYDYTLKKSRTGNIPKALKKYGFPTNLGMSKEGVTVRGAPGLRIFRKIGGGSVISDQPKEKREALILEAVELVRTELLKVVQQAPVSILPHQLAQSGTFLEALLDAVENRSNGRVEQALVGAKLQLRFPSDVIPIKPAYAGDRQTGRECDYEVGILRVSVSVTPTVEHFQSAESLADQGRDVYLVVADKSLLPSKKRIKQDGYSGKINVTTVNDYVTSNMKEISKDLGISAREMCLKLVAEYNRRVIADNDTSLQVALPKDRT